MICCVCSKLATTAVLNHRTGHLEQALYYCSSHAPLLQSDSALTEIAQLRAALADAIDLVERASTYAEDLKRKADSLKIYLCREETK